MDRITMSRPPLCRQDATQRVEWTRFQDGEFEILNLGSGCKAKASHSAETATNGELRFAVTMEESGEVHIDNDSADEVLQEDGSNREVRSSKSSFDDFPVCRKDSGVRTYSARVASGKDIFATAAEHPLSKRLRNANAALSDATQSIGFPTLVRCRPPVESEDESIPQPALKAFIAARKHRRKVTTPNKREQTGRSIRQQMAQPIPKLPKLFRPNLQHFDDQPYSPPVDFVPGSSEAAQWIGRMCDKYAYKRDSYFRYGQEIKDILASAVGRPAPARLTASREYKRILWLQEQLRLLLSDITAFMASSPKYIDLHEAACDAAERQAKENAEHFMFCLSILQDHYEKYAQTYAGVDQKIARWNDGFKFLQTESPWEHPETHTWEGWIWESWDPELFKNKVDAQVEIAQNEAAPNGDDMSDSLVDDLGEMMSNMVIGV